MNLFKLLKLRSMSMSFVAFLILISSVACQHKLAVSSLTVGTLQVNQQPPQKVGDEVVEVKVPIGIAPVRLTFQPEDPKKPAVSKTIKRDDVEWWVALGAGSAALCLTPGCVATSVLVANPFAVPALFLLGTVGIGPCVSVLAAPTWFTLPCAGLGILGGLSPLSSLLIAASPPKDVLLDPSTWALAPAPIFYPEGKLDEQRHKKKKRKKRKKKRRKKKRPHAGEKETGLEQPLSMLLTSTSFIENRMAF